MFYIIICNTVYIKIYFEKMYIDEPYVEPHPNFIRKFEPESNLKVDEPEPCDIDCKGWKKLAGRIFPRSLIEKISEVFLGCFIERSFYVWHYLDESEYV